jgi:hypothetical protein
MRVVPLAGVSARSLLPIADEIRECTTGTLEIQVELVEELPASRGKRKHVDQRIALDQALTQAVASGTGDDGPAPDGAPP